MNSVSSTSVLIAKPRVLILGSGTPTGGGSGPSMLVRNILEGRLNAELIGLVTHYPNGGVAQLGNKHEDVFPTHIMREFPVRKTGEDFSDEQIAKIHSLYQEMLEVFGWIENIDYILLSGWMKYVLGLPVDKTINIHPSRVDSAFGGEGRYGDAAHQNAFEAFQRREITETALTMHFVSEQIDGGPVIAQQVISLVGCATWEEAKARVIGPVEHAFQFAVTKAILDGKVRLVDGKVVWEDRFEFARADYHTGRFFGKAA